MNNVFDFQHNLPLIPAPPSTHHDCASTSAAAKHHPKPRKKRSSNSKPPTPPPLQNGVVSAETVRACSECGKKFWSWKALFGHMRCHPERHWRGINPPPSHRRPANSEPVIDSQHDILEDYEIAACLLLLANNGSDNHNDIIHNYDHHHHHHHHVEGNKDDDDNNNSTTVSHVSCAFFECSSCKKVFRSHQALGGHRASHKNVKGCFAMTRTSSNSTSTGDIHDNNFGLDFDLNLPAVKEAHDNAYCLVSSSYSSSPGLANLDLRLGL